MCPGEARRRAWICRSLLSPQRRAAVTWRALLLRAARTHGARSMYPPPHRPPPSEEGGRGGGRPAVADPPCLAWIRPPHMASAAAAMGGGGGRAGHRSSEPRGAGVEGEGRRRGRGGEERRGEGGRIRQPPWLGARRARIRPQPELATSIRTSPAAPARWRARDGRAGRGGEEAAEETRRTDRGGEQAAEEMRRRQRSVWGRERAEREWEGGRAAVGGKEKKN
ncbi:hypothetical protein PVAP13_9NG411214 [Panicum virgatum]|uniref:Uncharacterized protein n=1 Tax=Panicum virgatum TaxID=38727 RepID=A0A8T0MLG4_PANVG|nr:hypothetical protein PVAP13_9NG411214 [Panicum virgatum]